MSLPTKKSSRLHARVFALVLFIFGLILLAGGSKLLSLGGSWWYACSGLVLIGSALLLWRGNRWGAWVYGGVFAYTLVWSVWEVGLDGWALLPRLLVLAVLALWLSTPFVQRGLDSRRLGAAMWICAAVALAALSAGALLMRGNSVAARDSAGATPFDTAPTVDGHGGDSRAGEGPAGDWRNYAGDAAGTHYSDLGQIQSGNISRLKLAWSFRTGDIGRPGHEYNFEATPLKIADSLYVCTPSGQVFALDAVTGKEKWHFNAKSNTEGISSFICRGVTYYAAAASSAAAAGECAQRIYVTTPDVKLWSIDALTGMPCTGFGSGGSVDLKTGLGDVPKGMYAVTSPPVVTHGKLIVGAKVQDDVSIDMPSGVVRAFDAMTGTLAWAWDVGRPDRRDAPPPGETYTRSTPNAWAPLVADEALGLVYIPTGNPAADFWGMKRRPFDEHFGSSLTAVDVDTGETRWNFQFVHHDLWDNDVSSQPALVDVPTAEGQQPAVIIGTKQGYIFVLNRRTGAPIVPVTEKAVPGASSVGERLSATQPASALAVNPGAGVLREASMWGITPLDQMWCRIQYRKSRYEGPYTPLGAERATIVYPGMFGGIEWGGVSVDPVRKILISNPSAMPFLVKMAQVGGSATKLSKGLTEMLGTGYAAAYFGFLSPLKVPCMQPPWGKLYAIDLRTNQVLWERRVGTARDTGPLGIASHVPLLIGTPQVGGTVVTRGGLIFSAATLDRYLRAYDLKSGEELWNARLPAGGQATPMTYQAGKRQFVVIAAGGHHVLGTKSGDYVLAYALQ